MDLISNRKPKSSDSAVSRTLWLKLTLQIAFLEPRHVLPMSDMEYSLSDRDEARKFNAFGIGDLPFGFKGNFRIQ